MRIGFFLAAIALAGCDSGPATVAELKQERIERIDNHVRLQSKVENLEFKVRQLEDELEFTKRQVAK